MFALDIDQLKRAFSGSSSGQWTSAHEGHLNRHLANRNALPHVETHSKEQAKAWFRKILSYADLALSVGAFAALLVHHGVKKEESKQLALKWSGHLNNAQTGVSLGEKLWDIFDRHKDD